MSQLQSTTSTAPPARSTHGIWIACAVVIAVIALAVALKTAATPPPTPIVGVGASLAVDTFEEGATLPASWSRTKFVDSLMAHLAAVRGLQVHKSGDHAGEAGELTLRGRVGVSKERLVITASLWRRDSKTAVWTSTLWRDTSSSVQAARDVAAGVAETVFADAVKRTITKDKP